MHLEEDAGSRGSAGAAGAPEPRERRSRGSAGAAGAPEARAQLVTSAEVKRAQANEQKSSA